MCLLGYVVEEKLFCLIAQYVYKSFISHQEAVCQPGSSLGPDWGVCFNYHPVVLPAEGSSVGKMNCLQKLEKSRSMIEAARLLFNIPAAASKQLADCQSRFHPVPNCRCRLSPFFASADDVLRDASKAVIRRMSSCFGFGSRHRIR